jgi:hypothetical protein
MVRKQENDTQLPGISGARGGPRFRPPGLALLLGVLAGTPAVVAQQPVGPPVLVDVPILPSDTLGDVAVTVLERGRPVIYFNPVLMGRVGPRLARFFLAHEFGHIAHGDVGGALGSGDATFSTARRTQELEADCYAAERLAADPEDIAAVLHFFRLTADFRFDDLHPNGAERAGRISVCASRELGRTFALLPSDERSTGLVKVVAPATSVSGYACEIRIWIDQVPVGTVSNLRATARALTVRGLAPGAHEYTIVLQSYHLEQSLQFVPAGLVEGTGIVEVKEGDTLVIEWKPGSLPTLQAPR